MNESNTRRDFLRLAGVSIAATAIDLPTTSFAAEPFDRSGEPRFRVGLAAYSLRKYFSFMKGKATEPADPSKAIDMLGFIDYCKQQGFDAAELTSYFFRPDASDDYLRELKRQAYLRGVTISGTAIGNNFTLGAGDRLDSEIESAIGWIHKASVLGAPHIRFFAGKGKELDEHPERLGQAVSAMKTCADEAAKYGIFLGVENHGNLRPEQLLSVIHGVDHPWVGINLDTGNFLSDDPYADLAKCAPYAVNVQVKVTMTKPDRTKYEADMDRIAGILRDSGYQGFVILEYEEDEPFENIPKHADRLRKSLGV